MHVKLGHEELQTTVSVRLSKKAQSYTFVTSMATIAFIIVQQNVNNSRATVVAVILRLCMVYNKVDQWSPKLSRQRIIFPKAGERDHGWS